jgi:hypothetical protein
MLWQMRRAGCAGRRADDADLFRFVEAEAAELADRSRVAVVISLRVGSEKRLLRPSAKGPRDSI